MSTRRISLEKISGDYPTILVDTSVLIGYLGRESINTTRDSAYFFIKHICDGVGIYVTSSVLREYSNGSSFFHRKDLLDAIQDNSRILQFDEGEKLCYDLLFEEYSEIRDKFEVEETDYDFLVSGVVLSEVRKKPIALISNDIEILRAWKFLLMKESLSTIELGFFIRNGDKIFKKVKPPKNYKKL